MPDGRVSRNVWADVTCRGYDGISLSARLVAVNQGGTANLFVLDRTVSSVEDFLFPPELSDQRPFFIRKGLKRKKEDP